MEEARARVKNTEIIYIRKIIKTTDLEYFQQEQGISN